MSSSRPVCTSASTVARVEPCQARHHDLGLSEDVVLARIGRAALELWDIEAVPPPGWDVRPDWRRSEWQKFVAYASELHRDDAILLVTSNGAGRFALSAFGTLFGFVGMLVAVPVAAALGVLTRFAIAQYHGSLLYVGVAGRIPEDEDQA